MSTTSSDAGSKQPKPAKAVASNKVLVIGPKGVGKRFVLRKLVGANDLLLVDSAVLLQTAATAGAAATVIQYVRWAVDNKYYTALLDLHVVDSGVADASSAAHAAALGKDCQAVVLVFDSSDRASYDTITSQWLPFVKKYNPPILMLIGNEQPVASSAASATASASTAATAAADAKTERPAAARAAIEKLCSDAFDWGVDNGVEFIAVHPHNDNSKVKPHPAHFGPPEKYGTDRIAESLQANMWNHLQRKPMDNAFGGGGGGNGSGAARVKKSGDSLLGGGSGSGAKIAHTSKTVVDESSKVRATTTTTTAAKPSAAASASSASSNGSGGNNSSSSSSSSGSAGASKAASSSSQLQSLGAPKDAEDAAALERDMASFETLFAQMKQVRDRNAADPNLTDAERREAAEKAAVNLVRALGLGDDEDELAALQSEMRTMHMAMAGGAAGGAGGAAGAARAGGLAGLMGRGDIDIDHFDDDDDDVFGGGGGADGAMPLGDGDDGDELVMPTAATKPNSTSTSK